MGIVAAVPMSLGVLPFWCDTMVSNIWGAAYFNFCLISVKVSRSTRFHNRELQIKEILFCEKIARNGRFKHVLAKSECVRA